ncbi:hypothetical protein NCCP2331_23920 [Sporosarcina sp. NCCP-2331]|nr:hypothetical protein NCCP2331_23920 [Sporosarcina sp. NCCP-2331]GLB56275.1 hypothetical protein NCCP2378_20620 [Sporosarcina sp. NCCP-2378]
MEEKPCLYILRAFDKTYLLNLLVLVHQPPYSSRLKKRKDDLVYYEAVYSALKEKGFETVNEVHDYIGQFLVMLSDCLYIIENHFYKIVAIDIYRMKVRLLETDEKWTLLYDDYDKTIKHKL